MELYLQPKKGTPIANWLKSEEPITSSKFNRCLAKVLDAVAAALNEGHVNAVIEFEPGADPYSEWQVKSDPSLIKAPDTGYCKYLGTSLRKGANSA